MHLLSDIQYPYWNLYNGPVYTAQIDAEFWSSCVVPGNGGVELVIKPDPSGAKTYLVGGLDTQFSQNNEKYGTWSVTVVTPKVQGVGFYAGLYGLDSGGNNIWPPEITLVEAQGKDLTATSLGYSASLNIKTSGSVDFMSKSFEATPGSHTYSVTVEKNKDAPNLTTVIWKLDGARERSVSVDSRYFANVAKWKFGMGLLVGGASNTFVGKPTSETAVLNDSAAISSVEFSTP